MNIGKAAKFSGLTVKTVRFYSDIGIEPHIVQIPDIEFLKMMLLNFNS